MITIKSQQDIQILKEGGKKLAQVVSEIEKNVKPGKSTLKLDKLAEKLVFDLAGRPAFKGYKVPGAPAFPTTICASINHEVVHGIPVKNKVLQEGDLFKVDIGMEYKKLYTDMARTFSVGKISEEARRLMQTTEAVLDVGIDELRAGKNLSDYSRAVEKYVKSQGFEVVRNLVGHGVGYSVHEPPEIPNFYSRKFLDFKLRPGMVFALEPMVNLGRPETILVTDGWTFETLDKKLSAHFEDTVIITEGDPLIVTRL